ncbi:MAG: hypothetical protein ACRD29_04865 [Acidimicrobiales bacterium]
MARRRLFVNVTLVLIATLLATSSVGAEPRAVPSCEPGVYCRLEGTIGGAAYLIERSGDWNGTLVLYSHGYTAPGSPNPARNVGDPATGAWLLEHGYALAGSSYSTTGWALEQAFVDQTALLDFFADAVGTPVRTIAWGHSLGGIITAGLLHAARALGPELNEPFPTSPAFIQFQPSTFLRPFDTRRQPVGEAAA